MGAYTSRVRRTATSTGRGRHRAQPKRQSQPYNWLGAGAITFSVALGAALVSTPGVAEASKGSHHSPSHHYASSHSSGSSHAFGSSKASASAATSTSGSHSWKSHTSHHKQATADSTATTGTATTGKHGTHSHPLKYAAEHSSTTSTTGTKDTSADTTAVSSVVGTLAPFASGAAATTPKQFSLASVKTPAVTPLPNPLTLIGAAIAYDVRGIQHQMNPLISGVLGLYHLQQGVTDLKDLHLLGASLDFVSAGLSLAVVGLTILPVPGASLLIPPTAVLASTTATVNTIGQDLFHW